MRDEMAYDQLSQAAAVKHGHKRNMVSVVTSGLTNTNPSVGGLATTQEGKAVGSKYGMK
jgi:hypothetical protein